jgi:hypothetical protein
LSSRIQLNWSSSEDVVKKLMRRNKRMRIIGDELHVKTRTGTDPIFCRNAQTREEVIVRRKDWDRSSPAISVGESQVLLRVSSATFANSIEVLGIVAKSTSDPETRLGAPRKLQRKFFSIQDLIEIVRHLPPTTHIGHVTVAGEDEIRKLFSSGFVPYKKTRDGGFVPIWDETVY